jgi:hypothetical protein
MIVVYLNQFTPYQKTAWDGRPQGGSSGSSWRLITWRTEPCGREVRPITDVTGIALRERNGKTSVG